MVEKSTFASRRAPAEEGENEIEIESVRARAGERESRVYQKCFTCTSHNSNSSLLRLLCT